MLELSPYNFEDRLLFIGAALLVNFVIGSFALRKALGVDGLGNYLRNLLRSLEKRLNRIHRSAAERTARGSIVLLVMLLLTGIVASALSALTATHPYGWGWEVLLLGMFLPQRLIYDQGKQVLRLMKADDLDGARKAVGHFSLRDTHNLDKHAVLRAMMEYITGAFAERVLSPILWYILLGLPGFVASKIITETALMLGYESRRHKAYGKLPGRLETVINFIPARVGGVVMLVALLFVPKAKPSRAFACLIAESDAIHLPRKGQPIAAAAGGLGISLAGPHSVQGFLVKDGWVGKGSAKVGLQDFSKILLLYVIACLLNLAFIAILLLVLTL